MHELQNLSCQILARILHVWVWIWCSNYKKSIFPLQDDEGKVKKISTEGSKSKLPKSVQDLVCMIFDVESMEKAMLEFEVGASIDDMKKWW